MANYKCPNFGSCRNYVERSFQLCPECRQAALKLEGQPLHIDKHTENRERYERRHQGLKVERE